MLRIQRQPLVQPESEPNHVNGNEEVDSDRKDDRPNDGRVFSNLVLVHEPFRNWKQDVGKQKGEQNYYQDMGGSRNSPAYDDEVGGDSQITYDQRVIPSHLR